MTRLALLLALLAASCGGAPPPAEAPPPSASAVVTADVAPSAAPATSPTPGAAPHAPWTWWRVKPAPGYRGDVTEVGLFADEIVLLDARGGVHPRPGKLVSSVEHDFMWSGVSVGSGPAMCTLAEAEPTSRFTCTDEGGRSEAMALERVTDAKRRAELDALAAKNRPSGEACAHAEACCKKLFAMHGHTCNADEELGGDRLPDKCEQFLRGARDILAQEKKPVVAECK